jgi:protocatechuate 3,4-dioxygenase, alpha subunit
MPARTPSQTVGPYYAIALPWIDGGRITGCGGPPAVITGRVCDGAGQPVPDALVEAWQPVPKEAPAAPGGKPHGFARVGTGPDGTFRIETTLPEGDVPYLDVTVLARGLLKALVTRVYLAPEEKVRGHGAVAPIAGSPRLATLLARPKAPGEWQWDIRLQGAGETVFFTH